MFSSDVNISSLTDALLEDIEIYEYSYPKLSSAKFSYHKHPDPRHKGKYLDSGTCEICGKKGTYTLVTADKPYMCYKCYQAVRAYRNLNIDVLRLQRKKTLNVKQIKKIVTYMKTYSKKKALVYGLVGAYLLNSNKK